MDRSRNIFGNEMKGGTIKKSEPFEKEIREKIRQR